MKLTETQVSSEAIFQGKFLDINRDTVCLPNGKHTHRIVVRHPGAACVLAVTAQQQVVLVRQWRYPTGEALLEVPAGKLDVNGENPAACALRELAEETPYVADTVELLHTFYTAPGFCNEKMHLYLATNVRVGSSLSADEDEFVETVLLGRTEIRQMLAKNQIQDAKTLIALQYWLIYGAA